MGGGGGGGGGNQEVAACHSDRRYNTQLCLVKEEKNNWEGYFKERNAK